MSTADRYAIPVETYEWKVPEDFESRFKTPDIISFEELNGHGCFAPAPLFISGIRGLA